jgi:hypothetical protein
MSLFKSRLLGPIAGTTILIGGRSRRVRRPMPRTRAFLNDTAISVWLFIVWDVLAHARDQIDVRLAESHPGDGGLGAGHLVRRPVRALARSRAGRADDERASDRTPPAQRHVNEVGTYRDDDR